MLNDNYQYAAETQHNQQTALQLNFLHVPSGTATLGLEEKVAERFVNAYGEIWDDFYCREMPYHQVEIAAFDLARYPATNGLYARFMAEGGYDNADLWTPDGWAWRVRTRRSQPAYWGEPKFAGDDWPVVGVSWFEAMALARWAAVKTGANVRLPTEAEWEHAARVPGSKSLYPWGGAWDPNRLNSGVTADGSPKHTATAPVGTFSPHGDGPYGHAELLGQVWEWSSSLYKDYPYVVNDGREDLYTPEKRILRGGSWSDGKYANRVTTRYLYMPNYADITTGVRLAMGGSRPPITPRPQYDLLVYGKTAFCPDLVKAKQWLYAWNVSYRQLDIDLDEGAAARIDGWLGSRTVPTFVVAKRGEVEPITPPTDADLTRLRNMDRGSMLHEAEEETLRAFLVRHGFLSA